MNNLVAANVKQRPLRTAISIIGVALGVILIVLTVGLARGMERDMVERQTNVDAEIRFFPSTVSSMAANPLMLPQAYGDAILNGVQATEDNPGVEPKPPVPGVAAVTPVGQWLQTSAGGIGFEMVDGIDFESFVRAAPLRIIEGRPLTDGQKPGTEYEAIVDGYYAEVNKSTGGEPVRVGSKITVLGNEFTVVGVYAPSLLARVKIPLATMQNLMGGARNCTFIMVKAEQPERADEIIETIKAFYPGNHVIHTRDIPALYSQGITAVEVFLNVVIGLAIVISSLVILLGMYTTIIERTREIGILKSLGASKSFIVMTIEKEAALISTLGVVFGFLIAVLGKYGIEATTRLKITLEPEWLLIAGVIGIMCGIIGAIYPAMKAANLDPIEAISYE